MIKYEVRKEDHVEARKGCDLWFPNDMEKYYQNSSATYLELLESFDNAFDNADEAKIFFDKEKEYCQSYYQQGIIGKLVLFDVLELQEVEYDEDNEFQSAETLEQYIAPIDHNVDDIVGYVMDEMNSYSTSQEVKDFIIEHFDNIDDDDIEKVLNELKSTYLEEV